MPERDLLVWPRLSASDLPCFCERSPLVPGERFDFDEVMADAKERRMRACAKCQGKGGGIKEGRVEREKGRSLQEVSGWEIPESCWRR